MEVNRLYVTKEPCVNGHNRNGVTLKWGRLNESEMKYFSRKRKRTRGTHSLKVYRQGATTAFIGGVTGRGIISELDGFQESRMARLIPGVLSIEGHKRSRKTRPPTANLLTGPVEAGNERGNSKATRWRRAEEDLGTQSQVRAARRSSADDIQTQRKWKYNREPQGGQSRCLQKLN